MKELIKKFWNKEVLMYLIFGGLTTIVALAIYYALTYTVLDANNSIQLQIANVISWVGGVIFAYVTNRKYVFESKNKNKVAEAGKFVSARLVTLLMDMAIMFIFVTQLNLNDKIFKLVSQVVVIVANYVFSKLFVFKKK